MANFTKFPVINFSRYAYQAGGDNGIYWAYLFKIMYIIVSLFILRIYDWTEGALSIQPKISVGTSCGMVHGGLVQPEYSGPSLKVFDKIVVPNTALLYPAYPAY